jgi:hypothetical protein
MLSEQSWVPLTQEPKYLGISYGHISSLLIPVGLKGEWQSALSGVPFMPLVLIIFGPWINTISGGVLVCVGMVAWMASLAKFSGW